MKYINCQLLGTSYFLKLDATDINVANNEVFHIDIRDYKIDEFLESMETENEFDKKDLKIYLKN